MEDNRFDAFNKLLDDIDEGNVAADEPAESDKYIAELLKLTEQLKNMKPTEPPSPTIIAKSFDPKTNLLDPEVLAAFMAEQAVLVETPVLTRMKLTTMTLGGNISNVRFKVHELINMLVPDADIVKFTSNFGVSVYKNYVSTKPVKLSNRGRKPKVKVETNRKKQGTGKEFSSQITYHMRSRDYVIPEDTIIRADAQIYKCKLFCNGYVQIPGGSFSNIKDIIDCLNLIKSQINGVLHPNEPNTSKWCHLTNLNPTMKNYKLCVKLNPKELIDLDALKKQISVSANEAQPHPEIFSNKKTRQNSILCVKFKTPIKGNLQKKTRVNVFVSGKINILGGFDAVLEKQIFHFFNHLFMNYRDYIVVRLGIPRIQMNIAAPTQADMDAVVQKAQAKTDAVAQKNKA